MQRATPYIELVGAHVYIEVLQLRVSFVVTAVAVIRGKTIIEVKPLAGSGSAWIAPDLVTRSNGQPLIAATEGGA